MRTPARCRVMGVTESGYHPWRVRPQTRAEHEAQLLARIEMVHDESKGIYGAPRVHSVLKGEQVRCSRHRVARLMRSVGRRGKGRKQDKVTTDSDHAHPVAENLLMRRFNVAEPNTVWAADMTFIATSEGWLYLAVVLDLHSRMIAGWSMGSRLTTDLPLAALKMAFDRRHPTPDLLHHSDRGSQYASKTYQHALKGMRMTCSMSRKGDCFDNAVVEAFFASLKREECDRARCPTRDIAQQHVFAYLEQCHNRKRHHSSLNYLSPVNFEAQHLARQHRVA
ncbi:IS3 family transposase [Deinococcus sp.]|uniref:IS3 family transposase n=1 Tax=Deinococcus sp. TaxID=47478 RepID=UPI003C7A943A